MLVTAPARADSRTAARLCRPHGRHSRGHWKGASAVAAALSSSGCSVVPSVNILGSFFPAWLISIVAGVLLTLLSVQAFRLMTIAPYLRPAPVMYASLVFFWTFATWLLVFAS